MNRHRWIDRVKVVGVSTLLVTGVTTRLPAEEEPPSRTSSAAPVEAPAAASPEEPRGASPDAAEMIQIPEGEFTMGANDFQVEYPERKVWVDTFYMDKYEVTNQRFQKFVESTGHVTDAEKNGGSWLWNKSNNQWVQVPGSDWKHPQGPETSIEDKLEHPVINVSWNDAVAFCKWAGKRLPTEAEWEKAARGTDARKFPWGNTSPAERLLCNFADKQMAGIGVPWAEAAIDDGYLWTAPVGTFPDGVSPYGLYDMGGNVWEWCSDWYDEKYYQTAPNRNPPGPEKGTLKTLRSGCLISKVDVIRSACRYYKDPATPFVSSGFRCVRTTEP